MKLPSDSSSCTSDMEEEKSKCSCLLKFNTFLSNQFYKLGYVIAKFPSYFIILPVFLSLLSATGFQSMDYIRDPEFLFAPGNGQGRDERAVVENLFPINYTHYFDPSRITKISAFARLLVSSKDGDNMIQSHLWESLLEIDVAIRNLSVEWQDNKYSYTDICAKYSSQCIGNSILELQEIIPSVENGSTYIDYPLMLFPLILPFFYGGAEVNESEGILISAKAIALNYWFREDNWQQRERAYLYEQKILEMLDSTEFGNLQIARYVSMSLEEELQSNTITVLKYLIPTMMLMFAFSFFSISMLDWVRSKGQIALTGVLTACMAVACSFGLLMYCGVPFIGLNIAAPFLVLGIGIDDMFVLLSAWHRTNIRDDVPKRMADTYREAAVAITITSLTNILSFFIGAINPFPSVSIFCIYTGLSVLLTYIFCITFFGGCLALAGYQEKNQRHALFCKPVKSKSEAEEIGFCYSFWCAGGINKKDPFNPKDNEPHVVMVFFRDYFARMLNYGPMKVVVICSFLVYLAGAIYGCLHIQEGLVKKNMVLDSSYLINYYDQEDGLFRKFPYRIQVIITANLTYSDPDTKKQLLDLHETFENLTCVAPKLYSQSWFRGFHRFLRRRPSMRKSIVDEVSFIRILREEYLIPESPEWLDVNFNENYTRILSSRFIIQSFELRDTNADRDMMQTLRKTAEDAPFEVVVYYPFFVLWDQFLLVTPLTIQTICLVAVIMMVVSLVFIPNPLCSLWVIFSIVSIEVGVMGYMSLWNVNLDCISMINLIMCIGFSVDFSAHISYAYLTADVDTPEKRVQACMFSLGLPIVQSGLSTIAGVSVFIFAPSYIFETFFKVISLVIIFGTLHALFLLPVMLSLLGPGSCKKKPISLNRTISKVSGTISNHEIRDKNNVYLQNVSPILEDGSIRSSVCSSIEARSRGTDTSDTESATIKHTSSLKGGTTNLAFVCDRIRS